ncbi:hypothetical protein OIU34_04510 [Pararhizobium sp. BT-229]|uniref:hypothetical protein n=1 Tax=Pararhizobium sp. BT-229 TaxID=2986923 RepID=UPI0021F726F5|nr:hypothetical protein [Pararhizobium sp. BT-229]MCV9961155.1 hypothetical protein [Pararhizobium sp. BT-229]
MPDNPMLAHRNDIGAEWREYALQKLLLGFFQFGDAGLRRSTKPGIIQVIRVPGQAFKKDQAGQPSSKHQSLLHFGQEDR